MSTRRLCGIGLLVVAVGLGLSGCGGGGSKKTAASSGGTTIQTADFRFEPKTLTGKTGEAMTVTIKNVGSVEHNFSIESLKVNKDIEKGKSETVTFTPDKAGDIEFFCEYHKASNGMKGTLTVT